MPENKAKVLVQISFLTRILNVEDKIAMLRDLKNFVREEDQDRFQKTLFKNVRIIRNVERTSSLPTLEEEQPKNATAIDSRSVEEVPTIDEEHSRLRTKVINHLYSLLSMPPALQIGMIELEDGKALLPNNYAETLRQIQFLTPTLLAEESEKLYNEFALLVPQAVQKPLWYAFFKRIHFLPRSSSSSVAAKGRQYMKENLAPAPLSIEKKNVKELPAPNHGEKKSYEEVRKAKSLTCINEKRTGSVTAGRIAAETLLDAKGITPAPNALEPEVADALSQQKYPNPRTPPTPPPKNYPLRRRVEHAEALSKDPETIAPGQSVALSAQQRPGQAPPPPETTPLRPILEYAQVLTEDPETIIPDHSTAFSAQQCPIQESEAQSVDLQIVGKKPGCVTIARKRAEAIQRAQGFPPRSCSLDTPPDQKYTWRVRGEDIAQAVFGRRKSAADGERSSKNTCDSGYVSGDSTLINELQKGASETSSKSWASVSSTPVLNRDPSPGEDTILWDTRISVHDGGSDLNNYSQSSCLRGGGDGEASEGKPNIRLNGVERLLNKAPKGLIQYFACRYIPKSKRQRNCHEEAENESAEETIAETEKKGAEAEGDQEHTAESVAEKDDQGAGDAGRDVGDTEKTDENVGEAAKDTAAKAEDDSERKGCLRGGGDDEPRQRPREWTRSSKKGKNKSKEESSKRKPASNSSSSCTKDRTETISSSGSKSTRTGSGRRLTNIQMQIYSEGPRAVNLSRDGLIKEKQEKKRRIKEEMQRIKEQKASKKGKGKVEEDLEAEHADVESKLRKLKIDEARDRGDMRDAGDQQDSEDERDEDMQAEHENGDSREAVYDSSEEAELVSR